MATRFYPQETEPQERARKRNERRRVFSSAFVNGAIAFWAGALSTDNAPHAVEWFLIGVALICGALWWVGQTEAEF
jgi:hypothetical protein